MALTAVKGKTLRKKTTRATAQRKQGGKLQEPVWDGAESWDGKTFHRTYQYARDWYYQNFKQQDLVNYVFDWMKLNNYSKQDIQCAKAVPSYEISSTAGISARLLINGMPNTHKKYEEYWESLPGTMGNTKPVDSFLKDRIATAIEKGKELLKEKKQEEKNVKVSGMSIQQKMQEAAQRMTDEIEEALENLCIDSANFKVKEFEPVKMLRQAECKANHARLIRKWYEDQYAEFSELLGPKKKNDEWYDQLLEGYRHMDKTAQKKHYETYKKIVDACDIIIGEQKLNRKPRKAKEKSADKLVEKLKFKKTDETLGITSIPPTEIIGSEYLFVFNTKNRKLQMYQASTTDPQRLGRGGFSVKGTTLTGFNEETSLQKTLRKPVEQIKAFTSTRARAVKEFEAVKATETKLNGRLNEHCIILKTFK